VACGRWVSNGNVTEDVTTRKGAVGQYGRLS